MNKSPSISIIEHEMSTYTVTSSNSAIAVVGYATKGPIGVATLVTSLREFRDIFGYAALVPYSYLAIAKAFNQTNKVIFTRVADDTALTSQRVVNNIVAQTNGYRTLVRNTDVPASFSGLHAGELYGITVAARNMYISSKASGGWAIDDMVLKLTAELAATYGFQEFSNKNATFVSATTTKLYGFKFNLHGSGALSSKNVLIEVDNTDNISTLVTKINDQIANGTRSYTKSTIDSSIIGAQSAGNYSFKAAIGAQTPVEYTLALSTNTTIAQLVTKMNTAFAAADIADDLKLGVTTTFTDPNNNLVIYSKGLNISDTITLTAGTVGTDLLAIATLFGGWSAVAGAAGEGTGLSAAKAEYHIDTRRLRITDMVSGASSAIAINAPDAVFDCATGSLKTLLGNTETAVPGKAALSSITVSRDTTTRKIKFSSVGSTAAPGVSSLSDPPASYSLATLLKALDGTGTGIDTGVTGDTAVTADQSDKVIIESIEKGSATNLITVEKTTITDALTGDDTVTLEVYYDNVLKETFSGMSLATADDNFIETIVNEDPDNGGSAWINITTTDTDDDGEILFADGIYSVGAPDSDTDVAYDETHSTIGTYDYRVGTDGIPQIGGEELFIDALSTAGDLGNDEVHNFHILITPDNTTEAVQNAAITLAEARQDFMYIVDPALGLSYSQAKDWHNGIGGHGRSSAVNSSYAAVYWPWLKEYDTDNRKYVWCPPSVFIGEKYLEVDRVYNPWYAPAGDTRGRLTAQDIETSPSLAQRDVLYGDLNCVNPIVKFNAQGIEVYGQKTALRQLVASNRVNVKRMLIYIKKLVRVALNSMIFEPNNPDSWRVATNLVTGILEPIRQDNGLSQYRVIIDSSVNTPDVIAQNQMKGVIKLVPVNTIEMIEMNINVYKSGTTIT